MTLFGITTNSMLVQTFLLWVKMLSFSFLNVNFDRKKNKHNTSEHQKSSTDSFQ